MTPSIERTTVEEIRARQNVREVQAHRYGERGITNTKTTIYHDCATLLSLLSTLPHCLLCGRLTPCMFEKDLKPDDPGTPCTFEPACVTRAYENGVLQGRAEGLEMAALAVVINDMWTRRKP